MEKSAKTKKWILLALTFIISAIITFVLTYGILSDWEHFKQGLFSF